MKVMPIVDLSVKKGMGAIHLARPSLEWEL